MLRHHYPLGRIFALHRIILTVNKSEAHCSIPFGQVCKNIVELQTPVGYMKRQHPARRQLGHIKANCFMSHEMNWNSIGVESVQNNKSIMLPRRILQLETRIAQNNVSGTSCAFL